MASPSPELSPGPKVYTQVFPSTPLNYLPGSTITYTLGLGTMGIKLVRSTEGRVVIESTSRSPSPDASFAPISPLSPPLEAGDTILSVNGLEIWGNECGDVSWNKVRGQSEATTLYNYSTTRTFCSLLRSSPLLPPRRFSSQLIRFLKDRVDDVQIFVQKADPNFTSPEQLVTSSPPQASPPQATPPPYLPPYTYLPCPYTHLPTSSTSTSTYPPGRRGTRCEIGRGAKDGRLERSVRKRLPTPITNNPSRARFARANNPNPFGDSLRSSQINGYILYPLIPTQNLAISPYKTTEEVRQSEERRTA